MVIMGTIFLLAMTLVMVMAILIDRDYGYDSDGRRIELEDRTNAWRREHGGDEDRQRTLLMISRHKLPLNLSTAVFLSKNVHNQSLHRPCMTF